MPAHLRIVGQVGCQTRNPQTSVFFIQQVIHPDKCSQVFAETVIENKVHHIISIHLFKQFGKEGLKGIDDPEPLAHPGSFYMNVKVAGRGERSFQLSEVAGHKFETTQQSSNFLQSRDGFTSACKTETAFQVELYAWNQVIPFCCTLNAI